jgi:hypothetical protein
MIVEVGAPKSRMGKCRSKTDGSNTKFLSWWNVGGKTRNAGEHRGILKSMR